MRPSPAGTRWALARIRQNRCARILAMDDGSEFQASCDQLTETVTRKKVAGMEVACLLGFLFCLSNRSSSSFFRSPARPLFSAASNAFVVGP